VKHQAEIEERDFVPRTKELEHELFAEHYWEDETRGEETSGKRRKASDDEAGVIINIEEDGSDDYEALEARHRDVYSNRSDQNVRENYITSSHMVMKSRIRERVYCNKRGSPYLGSMLVSYAVTAADDWMPK
jgi:hypothetical protein